MPLGIHSGPQDFLEIYHFINIITYSMSSLVIVVNGIILLAYCLQRIRKPSYQLTPAGYLVLNLLTADCLAGVACFYATQFKMWPQNARAMADHQYLCPIRFAGGFLSFLGSHFALLCVVIDRYIAVLCTLQYRDRMTKSTCVKMIVVSWIIPVTGAIVIMTKNEWHHGVETCDEKTVISEFFVFVWFPTTVLVLVLIAIIQAKFHFELSKQAKSDSPVAIILRSVTRKSARVLLQSTTIFIVCWGFFDTSLLIFLFRQEKVSKLIYDIAFPVVVSSFLSNPMLYSYKTKSVGIPVKNLVLEIRNVLICREARRAASSPLAPKRFFPGKSPETILEYTNGAYLHSLQRGVERS